MNNNNNMAATVGIGAIGTILAYYGYNKIYVKTDGVEQMENHVMDGTGIGSTKDLQNKVIKSEVIESDAIKKEVIKKEVIKEINQTVTQENKDGDGIWATYWKTEYETTNGP